MANPKHVLAMTDLNSLRDYCQRNPEDRLDLTSVELADRDYAAERIRADFQGARLKNINFAKCDFQNSLLYTVSIENSNFDNAKCSSINFEAAKVKDTTFQNPNFYATNFQRLQAEKVMFDRSNMELCNFSNSVIVGGTFVGTILRSADFRYSNLKEANFSNADLTDAKFERADLSNADLRGANLHGANLKGANVKGAKIRRYDLEDIEVFDYCRLKPSQIQEMVIEDGYGEMRTRFSGFWTYIHALSILLWFFPIAWIVVRSLLLSHLTIGLVEKRTVEVSLFNQIIGYCISGQLAPSKNADPPYWHYPWNYLFFATWLVILVYNVTRARVIFKVKELEHKQTITGMHPLVTLEGELKWCYRLAHVLFWFNLVLALFHFGNFLMTEFPVPTTQ